MSGSPLLTSKYTIEYDEAVLNDLLKLPEKIQQQIIRAVDRLADAPHMGNVGQLKGYDKLYRLRTGDYRVVYMIENEVLIITIIALGPRKDIYEVLKRRVE